MIPHQLRSQVGLAAGQVEVTVAGAGLYVEAVADDDVAHEDGRPVIASAGAFIDDETVAALRHAGQR